MAGSAHAHDHGHNHGHDHRHVAELATSGRDSQRLLVSVLVLTVFYMLAEAAGGFFANSLALLSDAGHMLTDVAALALSLLAVRFSTRPATARKTYGFYRLEILAALANGVTLIVISLLICWEAYRRLMAPEPVRAWTLIAVSFGGVIVNLVSARLLVSRVDSENLNIRGAFLHIVGDLFGSVAAVIAGILILWKSWIWADPIFSVVISGLIIYSSWRLVSDAVNVLLEGTPSHINVTAVGEAMRQVPGVLEVHDLHIWTITSNRHAVTAHVVIDRPGESYRILRELRDMLTERFALTHATIQLEDPLISAMVNIKVEKQGITPL
jgi:cobalt-zinc-cadmium efflux system protein